MKSHLIKVKERQLDKIKYLIDAKAGDSDYLKDLLFVVSELDSLPELYHKQIRRISKKTLNKDIRQLMKDVPHNYLIDIIKKSESIDEAEENLILAEELI